MRTLRNIILVVLLALAGRTMADGLAVERVTMKAGETQQVAVNLKNTERQYAAFQFDLTLPEGISIAKNSKGKPLVSLNADRMDDHTLSVQETVAGTYRLLCFSLTNAEIADTDGPLFYVTLQADGKLADGERAVTISQQVFTAANGELFKWTDTKIVVSIESGGGEEIPDDPPVVEPSCDSLWVAYIELIKGETRQVAVNLKNKTRQYAAFQLDLTLPEGISIAKNSKGKPLVSLNADRMDDHTLSVQEITVDTYRLLCFSLTNAEIADTDGPLFYVTLQANESLADGERAVTISHQVFTAANGELYKWPDTQFSVVTKTVIEPVVVTAKSYTREYGEANPTFEFDSEGAALSGTPEIICEATANSPVGEYPIVIKKGGVTNYNDTYVNGTLTITKAPLIISVGEYIMKQGEPLPTFKPVYTGFKNGETEEVLTTKPTVTTSVTPSSEPGSFDVTVSGAESENYDIVYENGTITMTEADPVTITAMSYTREYGDANPTFEFTSEGAALSGTPETSCEATEKSPVGTYTIVIKKGSVQNYNDTYVNGTLTITKAPLIVEVMKAGREQYEKNPIFEIQYRGWKLDDDESVLTQKPVATTIATEDSPVGEYPIVVSGGEAENYELIYHNSILIVEVPAGIGTISVDHPVNVYNVQGRKVRSNATTLKGLPKGVYIVNGRKVVVYAGK